MTKLKLDIVTPYGVTFSDEVDSVSVKGSSGEFGILPDHVPLFTSVDLGILTYKKDGKEDYIAVMGGFIEVNENKVSVLSDSAEIADTIDKARANRAKEEAESEKMRKAGDLDFAKAEKDLQKSLIRLKALDLLEKAGRKPKLRM